MECNCTTKQKDTELVIVLMNENANEPVYATDGSAGMDIASTEGIIIPAWSRRLVHTGLKVKIPEGYEVQVRPRSGLALKHGITVLNTPGTIDSDYRGEIGVILVNLTDVDFEVKKHDRIAQMVVAPVIKVKTKVLTTAQDSLDETGRGTGGFGSTGK